MTKSVFTEEEQLYTKCKKTSCGYVWVEDGEIRRKNGVLNEHETVDVEMMRTAWLYLLGLGTGVNSHVKCLAP